MLQEVLKNGDVVKTESTGAKVKLFLSVRNKAAQ